MNSITSDHGGRGDRTYLGFPFHLDALAIPESKVFTLGMHVATYGRSKLECQSRQLLALKLGITLLFFWCFRFLFPASKGVQFSRCQHRNIRSVKFAGHYADRGLMSCGLLSVVCMTGRTIRALIGTCLA